MAIIKTQNNKRNAANDGWDVIHHETSGSIIVQDANNRLVTDAEKATWNGKIDKSIIDAAGDLIYGTADNTPARLAKGTAYQQLMMNAGATAPAWAASLQSLITATGDLIYGSAANTPARLAAGTARKQLAMNPGATAPEWVDSLQSLLTAPGDLIYGTAANTPARLAKGVDGQILTLASGFPSWANNDVYTITPSDTVILAADTERTNPTNLTTLAVKSFTVKNPGRYRIKCDIRSQYAGSQMQASYSVSVAGAVVESGTVGNTTTTSYSTKTKDIVINIPQNALIELFINNNNNIPYLKNAKLCGTLTTLATAVTLD